MACDSQTDMIFKLMQLPTSILGESQRWLTAHVLHVHFKMLHEIGKSIIDEFDFLYDGASGDL